ncbi:MAG: stage II sporulation protein R [Clostridiales bacterium]|jgi:stage II sporulation protein R|nr:stage II sporulation protein R [Clostridiales bacterium]
MRKLDFALLIGLVIAIVVSNFTSFEKSYESLQNGVLRLHILANSDSDEDQQLKLKVRDRILEYSSEFFGEGFSIDEVENSLKKKLDRIKEIAYEVIRENGFSYNVECEFVNMDFTAREYDGLTMPAGNYDALRITIGDAEGKNWWCVMYPPLCIPATTVKKDIDDADESETIITAKNSEDFFSKEEYEIMEHPERYKVRFKILEIYDGIKKRIAR